MDAYKQGKVVSPDSPLGETGLWLGGVKYIVGKAEKDEKAGDHTVTWIFAAAPKKGVHIAITRGTQKNQIVTGFYNEEKGQTSGKCKVAVLAYAEYLCGLGRARLKAAAAKAKQQLARAACESAARCKRARPDWTDGELFRAREAAIKASARRMWLEIDVDWDAHHRHDHNHNYDHDYSPDSDYSPDHDHNPAHYCNYLCNPPTTTTSDGPQIEQHDRDEWDIDSEA